MAEPSCSVAGRSEMTGPFGEASRSRSHQRPRPSCSSTAPRLAGCADQWAAHECASRGWSHRSSMMPGAMLAGAVDDDVPWPAPGPWVAVSGVPAADGDSSGGRSPVNRMEGRKQGAARGGAGRVTAGRGDAARLGDAAGSTGGESMTREDTAGPGGEGSAGWGLAAGIGSRRVRLAGRGRAPGSVVPWTGGETRLRVGQPKPCGSVALRGGTDWARGARDWGTVLGKACHGRPGKPTSVGRGSALMPGCAAGAFAVDEACAGARRRGKERFMEDKAAAARAACTDMVESGMGCNGGFGGLAWDAEVGRARWRRLPPRPGFGTVRRSFLWHTSSCTSRAPSR